jgi:2-iminobutanoate/2-iminopropanoate deaminase
MSAARTIQPADVAPPIGAYSQAILTEGAGQSLHIAGQVGLDGQGRLAEGFEAQAEAAWKNIVAILAAAGMGPHHLVKITTFMTDPAHLPLLAPVRSRYLGAARPASTLVFVRALARPEWLVEIEATAWRGSE